MAITWHTDEDVHGFGRRADNHSKDNQRHATDGDVAATKHVGQCAHKGDRGGKREEVSKNHPDPSVDSAQLGVDFWGNSAEEIDWNLRGGPEEGECQQCAPCFG